MPLTELGTGPNDAAVCKRIKATANPSQARSFVPASSHVRMQSHALAAIRITSRRYAGIG